MFEGLAHPDFPRRYWPSGAHLYQEKPYEEEYRTVFRALAASGRIMEINTKSPLSSVELIGWWRESGGRAVSFGSDAHLPGRVGDRFKLAVESSRQRASAPAATSTTSGASDGGSWGLAH